MNAVPKHRSLKTGAQRAAAALFIAEIVVAEQCSNCRLPEAVMHFFACAAAVYGGHAEIAIAKPRGRSGADCIPYQPYLARICS